MYQLADRGVIRLSDGAHIHKHDAEWQDYRAWLREGNSPLPPTIEVEPLEVRQDRAWSAIKEKREQVKHGGVLVAGKWFHSDEPSRVQQLGLMMMGAGVPAVPWKTMDGTFITLTQVIVQGIFAATAALDQAAFANAEGHKANMLSVDAPESYDYSAGWPTTYEA